MSRRRPLIVLAVLGIAAAALWRLELWPFAGRAGQGGPLTLYGNVDVRDVTLGFRIGGRIAEMRFEEGDRVRAGAVMATLDGEPAREELRLAEAVRDARRARLALLEAGSRAQEIERARAEVRGAAATHDNALRIFHRRKRLVAEDMISEQLFDDAEARMDETAARLAGARENLALAEDGFRDEEITEARAALAAAQARVERERTRLADTELRAPAGGVLFTRVEEPGAVVAPGAPVYTLVVDRPVWIRAYVSERDLGRIHPGLEAEVYTDARPDRPYTGQIGFISPQAEFTPKSVETPDLRTDLVYRLRIVVTEPDTGLRQGMPVTVRLPDAAPAPRE